MSDGKVYLSSDRVTNSNEVDDALFWTPNVQELTDSTILKDKISFYPLALNSSLQPSSPLLLESSIPARNVFVIPIFIRVKSITKSQINIKLSVDFVPKEIMKSSLVKELTVQVNVFKPFTTKFTISPLEYRNQYLGPDQLIFADCRNLMSSTVKCEKTLAQSSLTLMSSRVQLAQANVDQLTFAVDGLSLDKGVTQLKMDEEHITSIPFVWKSTNSSNNDSINVAKPGDFELLWQITGVHPLEFKSLDLEKLLKDKSSNANMELYKCGLFQSNPHYYWLLFPLRTSQLATEYQQVVNNGKALSSVASTLFPIPSLQVCNKMFQFCDCLSLKLIFTL